MFTHLSHILLGASLAMQLSPSIAAPAPLGRLRGLELRVKNNSERSLHKDALPEDGATGPFIILDTPPPTVRIQETRSLGNELGTGLELHFVPLVEEERRHLGPKQSSGSGGHKPSNGGLGWDSIGASGLTESPVLGEFHTAPM